MRVPLTASSMVPGDRTPEAGYRPRMATSTPSALSTWRRDAVRRMAAARASTLALVKRLPEPEILRPRTVDEWSVKDVLAHLMSCDEETVRRLRLIERGRANRIVSSSQLI